MRMQAIYFGLVLLSIGNALACSSAGNPSYTSAPTAPRTTGNVFDDFMLTDYAPADGFDFPFGDPNGKGEYSARQRANATFDEVRSHPAGRFDWLLSDKHKLRNDIACQRQAHRLFLGEL